MISTAIICLNEVDLIEKCISEVMWTNEIVVVDGGSMDGTMEKLKEMSEKEPKIRLFRVPFKGHFGDQKNIAISLCKFDWVFVFDADEQMEDGLKEELTLIAYNEVPICDAVRIPRKNYIDGMDTGHYPDYQYRFFRKFCRYVYPVHEELAGFRKLQDAKFHLLHYKGKERYERQQLLYDRYIKENKSDFRSPGEEWE